ncbi:coiled-coil domain-containing protein 55-domain containing protein [Suillus subluteus]|nr:coiled-coil domain-containing protein 55-domain containing protein [Suillus subluteus]
MKLSFSLPKTAKPVGAAPPLKKPAAFASLGDDDPVDAAPTLSDNKGAAANKKLLAQNVESSRAARKRMEQEMKVDATVYQYDEVWDRMQEVKLKQKEAKEVDSKRRKDKMMQREREAEGDEFADKEAFVTQAYKDQMAEVRRAEEEERQREEAEKKKQKGAPTGMAHFYRKLLEDSEQQHEEAVAATETKRVIGPRGPAPNLTITKPPELTPKSDLELAQLAKEQGKDVELNDDNQIVDKRELLSAGLNLSAPNTRRLGLQITKQTASTKKRERVSKQKEAHEEEARQRTILKRNTQEDVQNIRARYLARKRQKLEEEAVVASGSDDPVS